jgi:hypothetical protein
MIIGLVPSRPGRGNGTKMLIEPNMAKSLLHAIARIASAAGAVTALSACGLMGALGNDPTIVSYEFRQPVDFVRIERIEAGAPDNAHPFSISVEALRQALAGLQVEGSSSIKAVPMFTDAELLKIVPHLVAALAKAGPKEDVTFAVTGKHGLLGSFSSNSVTTGRLFARGPQLNVIFGLAQELYESAELGPVSSFPRGSRANRPDRVWRIVPKSGRLADQRLDWVALDSAATPAPEAKTGSASAAAPATPTADSRYQEIETKLSVLNRLKANGLITEGEYDERRRAILQGL